VFTALEATQGGGDLYIVSRSPVLRTRLSGDRRLAEVFESGGIAAFKVVRSSH
jgi:hypothetical protein